MWVRDRWQSEREGGKRKNWIKEQFEVLQGAVQMPAVPKLCECLWVHECLCPCISITYYIGHSPAACTLHNCCRAGDTRLMSTQSWARSKSLSFLQLSGRVTDQQCRRASAPAAIYSLHLEMDHYTENSLQWRISMEPKTDDTSQC